MIRIIVVDDEPLVRAGVRAVLEAAPDLLVVAEAADGVDALAACRDVAADVVLLDLAMPRLGGFDVAVRLQESFGLRVVVLTTFDEDARVRRALTEELAGFVLKASSPDELHLAVRTAAAGGQYVSPRITRRLLERAPSVATIDLPAFDDLTAREREVLRLLADGESNQGIGRRLSLGEGTVKTHVKAVLRKLEVDSRLRAAVLAHRAGWFAGDEGPAARSGRSGGSGPTR